VLLYVLHDLEQLDMIPQPEDGGRGERPPTPTSLIEERGGVLYVNRGAPAPAVPPPPVIALLQVAGGSLGAEIVEFSA